MEKLRKAAEFMWFTMVLVLMGTACFGCILAVNEMIKQVSHCK